MESLKFVEDGELSGTRITSDGYLVADVKCARTGIQEYRGYEFGFPNVDVFRVFRPEEEVFSEKSLATFAGKPATDDHPDEPVTADNWKKYSVGNIGNEVLRDGDFVRVPLVLMDSEVIQKVQSGKTSLSMGYVMALDFEEGTTPEGEQYDAVMRDLKMNHLAIVEKGRAGPEVRIGDSWGATPKPEDGKTIKMNLKTIVVDGIPVETNDAGAQVIEKLRAEATAQKEAHDKVVAEKDAAAKNAVESVKAERDSVVADKDRALAAKDAEIDSLKGQILTDSEMDVRVAQRAELVSRAKQMAKDADFAGKSDLEIKTIAVDASKGDGFCADKAPAYIEAAFDLIEVKSVDPVRQALINKPAQDNQPNDNGQSAYEKRLNDSWKMKKEAA